MKKKLSLLAAIALLLANILPVAGAYADPPATNATATINYTFDGNGAADIFIENVMLDQGEPVAHPPVSGTHSGTVNYTSTGDTVDIKLSTFATMSILTAVTINNQAYNVPTDQATLLNQIDGQVIEYEFNGISKQDTYTITTTTARSTLMGNFSWSYKDSDRIRDNYVSNGVISLVELEYDNVKYRSQAEINGANKPYLQYNISDAGAFNEFTLPTGTKVTLKLMPNAGYQLTSFTVNGGEFEAQEEVGVYTFSSESGNFHLGAKFTKVNDAVKADQADAVTSGSITLGGEEFDNGTARLEVKNATDISPDTIEGFETNSGDYNLKTILDIKLFNTIYKGSANATWDDQLDELSHEATITLKLDEGVDGNDVIIIHEKHNDAGEIIGYEVIPTVYDPVNHTITFKTSSFSNYAIATKTVKTIGSPNTGFGPADDASATEDTDPAIAILGMLALWGFLAFVAKKGLA